MTTKPITDFISRTAAWNPMPGSTRGELLRFARIVDADRTAVAARLDRIEARLDDLDRGGSVDHDSAATASAMQAEIERLKTDHERMQLENDRLAKALDYAISDYGRASRRADAYMSDLLGIARHAGTPQKVESVIAAIDTLRAQLATHDASISDYRAKLLAIGHVTDCYGPPDPETRDPRSWLQYADRIASDRIASAVKQVKYQVATLAAERDAADRHREIVEVSRAEAAAEVERLAAAQPVPAVVTVRDLIGPFIGRVIETPIMGCPGNYAQMRVVLEGRHYCAFMGRRDPVTNEAIGKLKWRGWGDGCDPVPVGDWGDDEDLDAPARLVPLATADASPLDRGPITPPTLRRPEIGDRVWARIEGRLANVEPSGRHVVEIAATRDAKQFVWVDAAEVEPIGETGGAK